MRNLLRMLWMALLLLIVALLAALTAMRLAIHGREVAVPDLRSKSPAEARRIADAAGLSMQVESSYYSANVPEGKVLSQMPPAGTVVRRGWELQVAVSLGPQRVAIPQIVGASERAAAITLAQRGLEIASTARTGVPGSEAGQVIAQSPPANATDVSAPKVSLLVSQENPAQAFVMPRFVGGFLGSANVALQNAGLKVGNVALAPADFPPAGANESVASTPPPSPTSSTSPAPVVSPASMIISQDPPAGSKVSAGSAINFVVR